MARRASISVNAISPRGRRFVDPMIARKPCCRMMIDVGSPVIDQARHAGARQLAAFQDQRGVNALPTSCVIWMAATPGNGCRNTGMSADGRVLADRAQRQCHRHRRTDRVAVGTLMRRDDESPPLTNRLEQIGRRL
jgi:hypothetical protein